MKVDYRTRLSTISIVLAVSLALGGCANMNTVHRQTQLPKIRR